MDIDMPVKDGFETSQIIYYYYEQQNMSKPTIIACSAFIDQQTKTKC